MIDLYQEYQADKIYKAGDVFRYKDKLYKAIQAHTSQDNWIPSQLPALYKNLMPENIIDEWRQPALKLMQMNSTVLLINQQF